MQVIAAVMALLHDQRKIHELINSLKLHLPDFIGLSRRFEMIGKILGCHIYDDYAHHPTEVYVVLEAARQRFPLKRLLVVFQPHTYRHSLEQYVNCEYSNFCTLCQTEFWSLFCSRLAALKDDFAFALSYADHIVITAVQVPQPL